MLRHFAFLPATVVLMTRGLLPSPIAAAPAIGGMHAGAPLGRVNYILHGLGVAPPGRALHAGSKGEGVFQRYLLRTGSREKASVRFHDGTTLHINEDTDAVLESPNSTRVTKGEVAEYIKPGTNHQVVAASAIAASIGTEYDVQVANGRARFVVLHGALRVTSANRQVVVKSNHQTYVSQGTAPTPPSPVDAKAVFAWNSGIPTPDLGEDVALDANGGTIVASSSQLVPGGGNGDVHHIADGLLSEGWISAAGKTKNEWVKVGFVGGNSFRISDVIIDPAATGGAPSTEDLKDFQIRVSTTGTDDASFTTVLQATCKRADRLQRFSLPEPVRARYIELVAVDNYGSKQGIAVAEWEVVATASLFGLPSGLAVDPQGNVYVADTNNNRVVKLSRRGKVLATWGRKGSGPGQFLRPLGIALDRNNNVYVADTQNGRVQELSPSGKPVASWGTSGTGSGQLEFPAGVGVDAGGNVYVTDMAGRVQKFSHGGKLLALWQTFGVAGTLSQPVGLAVGPSGHIAVADAGNNRVLVLSATGSVLKVVGTVGSRPGQFQEPRGVAFDRSGGLIVADSSNNRVQRIASNGKVTVIGRIGSGPGQMYLPQAVATDAAGNIYASDYGNSRVEKFSPAGKLLSTWGKYATVANVLGQPAGIAVDSHGFIYVADETNDRVQVRDPRGHVVAIYGHHGFTLAEHVPGLGQFWYPHGVAIGPDGAIYVADTFNSRVQILANRGPIGALGAPGTAGALHIPMGVAVDSAGNMYVADTYQNRVEVFSTAGAVVRTIGSEGTGSGQFDLPEGIAVDGKGNIYVSDVNGNRVQKFAPDGRFVASWGNPNDLVSSKFFAPRGLAVDAAGNVYVADLGHNVVQKLSPDGVELQSFDLPGPNATPSYVAVDTAGNVYVTDELNARIVKFSPGGEVLAVWS